LQMRRRTRNQKGRRHLRAAGLVRVDFRTDAPNAEADGAVLIHLLSFAQDPKFFAHGGGRVAHLVNRFLQVFP
jgi:hypothetical protein